MWVFRHLPGLPDKFKVGYYEMYWETETQQAQRFVDPYGNSFTLDQAEAKVHYLNGGSAGAVGDLQDSLTDRFPRITI